MFPYLFLLLFIGIFIVFLIGLVKPHVVIRWGDTEKKTRRNVAKVFGSLLVIAFIGLMFTVPELTEDQKVIRAESLLADAQEDLKK